jgi:hypothetical protein
VLDDEETFDFYSYTDSDDEPFGLVWWSTTPSSIVVDPLKPAKGHFPPPNHNPSLLQTTSYSFIENRNLGLSSNKVLDKALASEILVMDSEPNHLKLVVEKYVTPNALSMLAIT